MLAQSRAFFSLPLEAKRSVLANELNRGYTPFEEEVGEKSFTLDTLNP